MAVAERRGGKESVAFYDTQRWAEVARAVTNPGMSALCFAERGPALSAILLVVVAGPPAMVLALGEAGEALASVELPGLGVQTLAPRRGPGPVIFCAGERGVGAGVRIFSCDAGGRGMACLATLDHGLEVDGDQGPAVRWVGRPPRVFREVLGEGVQGSPPGFEAVRHPSLEADKRGELFMHATDPRALAKGAAKARGQGDWVRWQPSALTTTARGPLP